MTQVQSGCFSALKRIFSRSRPGKTEPTSCACFSNRSLPEWTGKITTDYASQIPCATRFEASLGPPPAYIRSSNDEYKPEVLETIKETIDNLDSELRELALDIHDHPELGFQEKYAHDTLTKLMSSHGFEVTPHYAGLSTAWRAEFTHGSGGRVLGVNSEMDALPGIGHACGHNLIAAAGVGVALAAKVAMQKHNISGKVVLLGTPAEEGGGGKAILIERGAYKEMDLCVMSHPTAGPKATASLGSSLALQAIEVEFFGHTAHAAAAPWEGQNALDAAFLAYSGVSVLRQQMKPDHRVHGIVEGRNWAANVIPDYAKMRWYVRAPTFPEVEVLRDRVIACFEAAALATSCKSKIVAEKPHYDLIQNVVLGQDFSEVASKVGLEIIPVGLGGSTDFGNVTYEVPALHPRYAIPTEPNGSNHTPAFAQAAATKAAHNASMRTVKALAFTAVRALDDDKFYKRVRKSFDRI